MLAKIEVNKDVPWKPLVRWREVKGSYGRQIQLDLRGIRDPHNPLNGHINPTVGVKPKFVTPEHLKCMVDEYFESCNGPLLDKYGQIQYDKKGNIIKVQIKPYTVSGLALHIGITTASLKKYRVGLIDTILQEMKAETNDEPTFAQVLFEAKQKIEAYAENRLYDQQGQRGAQFVLDNVYGWTSRKERAEINKMRAEAKLKRDEFELKRKLIDEGEEDSSLTINIVRGKKKDTE